MRRPVLAALIATVLLTTSTLHADNSFYRITAVKPNATVADAVRAFFILVLGPDPADMSFEKQAQALLDMKIIRKGWTRDPGARLTRGKVAYMICRSTGIRGGVSMHILGPTERYCYRECTYLRLMVGGTPRDYMSGGELLGALAKAAEYAEQHPDDKAALKGSAEETKKEAETAAAERARKAAEERKAAEAEKPKDAEKQP
jgi:hypothetical protein